MSTHNQNKLSIIPSKIIILNAINDNGDNYNAIQLYIHIETLSSQILLKLNMLVKIYPSNYNTQDGLVNWLDRKFKSYIKANDFDIVSIKFNDPHIGHQQAIQLAQWYNNFHW